MKSYKKLFRLGSILLLLLGGVWLLSLTSGPTPESLERQQAIQAFAPVDIGDRDAVGEIVEQSISFPTTVNLADIPAGVYDPNNQYDRWQRGEIDLQEGFMRLPEAELALLQAAALEIPSSANVQLAPTGPGVLAPTSGISFDSIDFTECCGGGGNVPPDPEIAAGPNHIIAVVNVAFEIYDKSGNSLAGPTTFASFMASNPACTGVFDPNVLYDEREDRWMLAIDADGTDYCLAVSQTSDPTGSWNLYSFVTGSSSLFFDYPHAGVGNDAIYMGANMFNNFTNAFVDSRIWAFDKAAMYAGSAASSVMINLGSNDDTPQPLNLHGWNQGTWPTSGPHYFITETGYNGADHTIYSWSDPFGANTFGTVGGVNLNTATGVTAAQSVSFPQASGGTLQGNDWRPQDFEYRNGSAWTTMTIGCNPGSGTVNCVRWAQINPATATVLDAGVYSSNGEYRQFPDLAVNHCDDMAVGYTKSSSSIFPSIFVTGRESTDAAGTLQAEVQLKAGEISYTSFETSAPRRWGDYTEMTIDPDGLTFWYLGEYSKDTGTTQGRWGTFIGSYSFGNCTVGGPTPTPTSPPTATNTPIPTNTPGPTDTPPPPPTATNTPEPTNTPVPGTCTTYNSSDTPISLPNGTTSISSDINVSGSGTIDDINVSVDMPHAWVGDLIFTVSHLGSNVTIIDRPGVPASTFGCSGDDILATLDDEAATAVENQCAGSTPTINGTFSPNQALSAFDGASGDGTWTLTVEDAYTSADSGTLNGWSIEVCTTGAGPTPTNTPIPPTATNTPVPTATNTPVPGGDDVIYVSSSSGGNAGGVAFSDEDILSYDTGTGTWAMYIDGSDIGLSGSGARDVDAFFIMPDGTVLFSFVSATTIPDVGSVDDSDIVQFTPTSTGTTTAGTFSWYFDGSDVELTSNGEDVDAIGFAPDGRLLISTSGSPSVSGVSGDSDEDLLAFTATSLGSTTSGTWAMYFDGSDVGLGGNSSEDTAGTWVDANGDIYLTTRGSFSVTGASGTATDIFTCVPGSLGATTSCTFALFWDGSANGFGSETTDGIHIVP